MYKVDRVHTYDPTIPLSYMYFFKFYLKELTSYIFQFLLSGLYNKMHKSYMFDLMNSDMCILMLTIIQISNILIF